MNAEQAMEEIIKILADRHPTNMEQFIAISHVADKYRFKQLVKNAPAIVERLV